MQIPAEILFCTDLTRRGAGTHAREFALRATQ